MPEDKPEAETEEESEPAEALNALISNDWDAFMSSNVWDAQTANLSEHGSDETTGGNLPQTSARIDNGLFFNDLLASGSRFSAKFFYDNETEFYCMGSLIGYPYILTAAHCGIVEGDDVRVGGSLLRSGYKATVDKVFIHPNFDRQSLVNDIAIVRLNGLEDRKVLRQNGVKAAKIAEEDPSEGHALLVSGHGSRNGSPNDVSEELHTTRQFVHNDNKCVEEITQGELKAEDSYMCAGDGATSTTCVGDSGAGLFRYDGRINAKGKKIGFYTIVGVVSFGEVNDDSLCPRGPPTVYQQVSEHTGWIKETVGIENLA